MKNFLLTTIVTLTAVFSQPALASPEICYEGSYDLDPSLGIQSQSFYGLDDGFLPTASNKLQCEKVEALADSLRVTSIALSLVGLGASCTGIGLPVSVAIATTGASLRYLAVRVSRLPCEDLKTEEEIPPVALDFLCDEFLSIGILCQPQEVEIIYRGTPFREKLYSL